MSILPNIFSDPVLRTRQDQLNSQWISLNASVNTCKVDESSSSIWLEFVADFKGWQEFYDSGSDWSMDSKHATDEWQTKASDWSGRLGEICGGVSGIQLAGDTGIPTVKANPADDKPFWSPLTDTINTIHSDASTIGWVAIGVIVLVVLVIGYVLTKGHASGYGVTVGE